MKNYRKAYARLRAAVCLLLVVFVFVFLCSGFTIDVDKPSSSHMLTPVSSLTPSPLDSTEPTPALAEPSEEPLETALPSTSPSASQIPAVSETPSVSAVPSTSQMPLPSVTDTFPQPSPTTAPNILRATGKYTREQGNIWLHYSFTINGDGKSGVDSPTLFANLSMLSTTLTRADGSKYTGTLPAAPSFDTLFELDSERFAVLKNGKEEPGFKPNAEGSRTTFKNGILCVDAVDGKSTDVYTVELWLNLKDDAKLKYLSEGIALHSSLTAELTAKELEHSVAAGASAELKNELLRKTVFSESYDRTCWVVTIDPYGSEIKDASLLDTLSANAVLDSETIWLYKAMRSSNGEVITDISQYTSEQRVTEGFEITVIGGEGAPNSFMATLPDGKLTYIMAYETWRTAPGSTKNTVELFAGGQSIDAVSYTASEPAPNTVVTVIKTDTDGAPLSGARLIVRDEDGIVVASWITDDKPHTMTGYLIAGEEYTLAETDAPQGYSLIKPVPFTVPTDGTELKLTVANKLAPTPKPTPTATPKPTPTSTTMPAPTSVPTRSYGPVTPAPTSVDTGDSSDSLFTWLIVFAVAGIALIAVLISWFIERDRRLRHEARR